ncbi:MAG: hypothetical protein EPO42_14315 [Gallionellaceae bacterium]|nr:MAG: hypothetical protein EPO42_14315 [Gallionellaceae bacterium]
MEHANTIAKLFSVALILFGLFALLVVSIPTNRQEMFVFPGRRWRYVLAVTQAYATAGSMVACGLAVWLWPSAASILAGLTLALVVTGKLLTVAEEREIRCVRCLLIGPVATLAATAPIFVGVA